MGPPDRTPRPPDTLPRPGGRLVRYCFAPFPSVDTGGFAGGGGGAFGWPCAIRFPRSATYAELLGFFTFDRASFDPVFLLIGLSRVLAIATSDGVALTMAATLGPRESQSWDQRTAPGDLDRFVDRFSLGNKKSRPVIGRQMTSTQRLLRWKGSALRGRRGE
jgi:hypothetical protein